MNTAVMQYCARILSLSLFLMLWAAPQALGQTDPPTPGDDFELDKLAQSSMKFLSVSMDARAAGMADAVTALEHRGAAAMFYNPSTMARFNGSVSATFSRTEWLVDINHNAAGLAYRPGHGQYGVFGLSFRSVDYGEFNRTILADNDQGFVDRGSYSPSALSVGLGYARALTDRVVVGGNVKYARQHLAESILSVDDDGQEQTTAYTEGTAVFDFGLLYQTGFRSLNFAMSVRDFSRELEYAEANFELPLTFRVGVMMDLMDLTPIDSDVHSLNLGIDARRSRDYDEQLKFGGEYVFLQTLALRAGYTTPSDEESFNVGAGVQHSLGGYGFAFNYAYTDFGIFNNVHRLSVQLGF